MIPRVMRRRNQLKRRRKVGYFLGVLIVLIIATGLIIWSMPLPNVTTNTSYSLPTTQALDLPWPANTESAIGAVGYNILDTYGDQSPKPTASVGKIITAIAVLQKYPLNLNEQGPTFTLTADDVNNYQSYQAENGSVVAVTAGEQITEYQALEAMLLPSSNNMADSIAKWAFGSLPNYATYARQMLKSLNIAHTTIGTDASGFQPSTTSTASDLTLLGELAMQNPVLTQIVGFKQAVIPVAGTIQNVNRLLGQDGVVGIKTGNTDQAGGVYLFASKVTLSDSENITLVGAIMGSPTLGSALAGATPLIKSANNNFKLVNLVKAGQVVGTYSIPWQGNVNVVASNDLSVPIWLGSVGSSQEVLNKINGQQAAQSSAGYIKINYGSNTYNVAVKLQGQIVEPSWHWRLIGRFK